MHEGCAGQFADGRQILEKVRSMGFSRMSVPVPLDITCGCGTVFQMLTMESSCPDCGMLYAVTPCHAYSASHVMPAGVELSASLAPMSDKR